jgi:STE24 endopeptidase
LEFVLAILYVAYLSLDTVLTAAQIAFVKQARGAKPALLPVADWQKAADYEVACLRFSIGSNIFSTLILALWFLAGFSALDQAIAIDSATAKAAAFVASFLAIGAILNLPLEYYKTFAIDEKFGFNRSTKKLFFIDFVKGLVMLIVVASILSCAFAFIARSFAPPLNFSGVFYAFAAAITFIILVNLLFPYIARIFNKFEPIDDTPLGAKIKELLARAGFGANGVFRIDASKRDARLNAYFAGIGKTKRVALYDTLIEKLSESEILAVLGHELGHFKHKDIWKRLCAIGVEIWVICLFFYALLDFDLYSALNLPQGAHIAMALCVVFAAPIDFFFQPLINAISRRAEFAADAYGAALTDKTDLKNALVKLAVENRAFPRKLPIYALWRETHPGVLTRIERLTNG